MNDLLQKAIVLGANLCAAIVSGCAAETPDLAPSPVHAALDVEIHSGFTFTISPDDRWLVFFERWPEAMTQPLPMYARLRAVDLRDGKLFEFDLDVDQNSERVPSEHSQRGWSEDGRIWWFGRLALVFNDSVGPRKVDIEWTGHGDVTIGEQLFPKSDFNFCSDCYEGMFNTTIARQVSDRADHIGHLSRGEAVVSPEQEFIYYSHKPHDRKLEITQRTIETGKDRALTTHTGPNVSASYLRLSPDGKFLAYQITTEPLFTRPPKLYIVDVETEERWYVGEHVFYPMHWTSDSKRLYFAKRDRPQDPTMEIDYVEPPRDVAGE